MHPISDPIIQWIRQKNPHETEFHQTVSEVVGTLTPVLDRHREYRRAKILERLVEPERVIIFRVPWLDDQGDVQVNRGYRVEMNSAIGPYKGGLRFHPSVNLSILKSLAFEQIFKNALTTLPLGAGKGGADFDPKGKTDTEVMRFCQAFMSELYRHIDVDTDVPAGDIGVGSREIGYLFGMYKKLRNKFTSALTGKGLAWGGSLLRTQATGYGVVYFAAEMLAAQRQTLSGKRCLVSGSGNVAQHTLEKLIDLGARPVTFSDSSGFVLDNDGLDQQKLAYLKEIKNIRRGRVQEYLERYPMAEFHPVEPAADHNALWLQKAVYAFPCATEQEINAKDALAMAANGISMVCEGANIATSIEGTRILQEHGCLFAPGKAANAGGVSVSSLEMTQNSMRLSWTLPEVDSRLRLIMKAIHQTCLETAAAYGSPGDYVAGANIAGFIKVVNAMLDQGVV